MDEAATSATPPAEATKSDPRGESRTSDGEQFNEGSTEATIQHSSSELVVSEKNVVEDAVDPKTGVSHVVPEAVDPMTIPLTEMEVKDELDVLVEKESFNTFSRIESLRFKPKTKSRLNIPLCRLIGLAAVRPAMKNDILQLQGQFVNGGYLEGHGVFYVALENDDKKTVDVNEEVTASWSPHWHTVNNEFENQLRADPVTDLAHAVPNWNEPSAIFLKSAMQFSSRFLHDDGVMLIFYPDSLAIKKEIMSFFKNYKLKMFDEWNVFQTLPLASHANPLKIVSIHFLTKTTVCSSFVELKLWEFWVFSSGHCLCIVACVVRMLTLAVV